MGKWSHAATIFSTPLSFYSLLILLQQFFVLLSSHMIYLNRLHIHVHAMWQCSGSDEVTWERSDCNGLWTDDSAYPKAVLWPLSQACLFISSLQFTQFLRCYRPFFVSSPFRILLLPLIRSSSFGLPLATTPSSLLESGSVSLRSSLSTWCENKISHWTH